MLGYILAAAGVWLLQGAFGLWQVRHFNQGFKRLRQEGRVVVGKSKGRIRAGAVVMFCLDQDDHIIRGEKMAGISVFARLQPFSVLNDLNLLKLEQNTCQGLDKQTTRAVLNAVENYQAFMKANNDGLAGKGGKTAEVTV